MRATRLSKLRLKALRADANTIADVPLSVEAVTGQTANLQNFYDASGSLVCSVDVNGNPTFPAGSVLEAALKTSASFGLGAVRVAKAKYSFAVDGGAIATITPATNATIPDNAIVFGGLLNPTTALTSGGSATIAVGTSAGSSTTSLKTATAVATYSADAVLATVPVFTAGSAFKMTAAGSITITVATAALTAGILEIIVFYVVAAA